MNILFTCAGRRHYLLEYFKSIKDIKVFACDASLYAPALYTAHEFFLVPDVYDLNYINILLDEARARNINAIIPLNDLELPVLAANKERFEANGIKVLISDENVVDICFDKYKTVKFSEGISVSKIPTFLHPADALRYKKKYPECSLILKPRWGSASVGIEYPKDENDLLYRYELLKRNLIKSIPGEIRDFDPDNCILIQRVINGQEYGMDVINNFKGEPVAVFLRKKIAMRAGETDKAETIYDAGLNKIGEEIGRKLKHIGLLDCDLIIENDDIYLLEMNPRFGGGYPFMHYAGANFPLALVEWLRGRETPEGCFNYKNGSLSAKVDIIIGLNPK